MFIKSEKGFTLIELMVAVSIFTVVATIATGAVISANQLNKKAQAIKLVMDNLNFALDSMTLKMKKGGGYYCSSATTDGNFSGPTPTYPTDFDSKECTTGDTAIAFGLDDGVTKYIYRFNNGSIQFSQNSGGGMSPFTPITASEVVINVAKSRFYVFDTNSAEKQPRILISIYGTATTGHESSDFAIETTVSDRR